jgi:hypothetical protein
MPIFEKAEGAVFPKTLGPELEFTSGVGEMDIFPSLSNQREATKRRLIAEGAGGALTVLSQFY